MSIAAATEHDLVTLAARSLTKRFGSRVALRAVSMELRGGELVAVIGPNGAGKTTLLSILVGVMPPSEGEITRPPREIGWVPQRTAVYSRLSVAENLRLFARLEKLADPERAVQRMLDETGLKGRADEEVSRLSGGNQQRVNIAIGLLREPSVLLLDEPSASLDPRQRARLWEYIGTLAARGTTVVFSTHNVTEAERYAGRLLVLVDGELLFTGTAGELEQAVASELGQPLMGAGEEQDPGEDLLSRDFEAAFVNFLRHRGH